MPSKATPAKNTPAKQEDVQPGSPRHSLLTLGRMYAEAIASRPSLERQILARAAEELCQSVSKHLGD